ncbi:type III secretion protein R [Kluyvera sp. 1366]
MENYSIPQPLSLLLILSIASLIPLLLVISTCFLKISIVLILTRNALGVQQVPPNLVLYGMSLVATAFIMAPYYSETYKIYSSNTIVFDSIANASESLSGIIEPLVRFMIKHADPDVISSFLRKSIDLWPSSMSSQVDEQSVLIVLPSFVVSELQNAFKIGFVIFIPFLIVDLLVSNILMALGMQMVSPMTVSLPLKILLFISVDGWNRLLNNLFYSYI